MTDRTITKSIETEVEPDAVLAVLVDPKRLPQWAPAFADEVDFDLSAGWQVTKDGNTFSLEVAVSPSSRTVDYLREIVSGKRGGAYVRVVPRPGNGSVIIMTLPLLADANSERLAAILSQELETLIKLCGAR